MEYVHTKFVFQVSGFQLVFSFLQTLGNNDCERGDLLFRTCVFT